MYTAIYPIPAGPESSKKGIHYNVYAMADHPLCKLLKRYRII